ncbi:MAG: SHOCT domain-containing protein [Sulfurimonas sp.]|uniref:SHOCT domain-containing protein n=1 Tax=Sulfurimonas sp. TaxID=2022749 RepID=UPI00260DD423|nr:SHOCT domain-containing protein [Sulfurimonas sp.]MDD5399634.1 SHOCT domain-containing protein [Sulfurimonas sp.]
MKKILILSSLLAVAVMFSACGSKSPYKEQKPLDDAALVYVYVVSQSGVADNNKDHAYKIKVNGKNVEGYVKADEYIALDLKPGSVEVTAIRADVEAQSIKLELKAGDINYLKIKSFSDGFAKFDIIKSQSVVAKKEIAKTVSANSKNIVEKEIESATIFAEKKEPAKESVVQSTPVAASVSKTDELEKAYKLKEKGIISEEEFKTLKSQIITK